MAINSNVCLHLFTFTLMMTGAFSRNVGKLFSELKLVTDNLLFNSLLVKQPPHQVLNNSSQSAFKGHHEWSNNGGLTHASRTCYEDLSFLLFFTSMPPWWTACVCGCTPPWVVRFWRKQPLSWEVSAPHIASFPVSHHSLCHFSTNSILQSV